MEQSKNTIVSYLDDISVFLLGILLIIFPLSILTFTTDFFILPKETVFGAIVLLCLFLIGLKMLINARILIRRTPFDLPILLLTVAVFLSSVFAVNRADSLINFVPFLFGILAFFVIVNSAKEKNSVMFLVYSLMIGACITAVISLLSFLKIYILPFPITHAPTFSATGSLLDQVMYLAIVLPLSGYLAWPNLSSGLIPNKPDHGINVDENSRQTHGLQDKTTKTVFIISSIIIIIGLFITIYNIFSSPASGVVILPFENGFQTAFASISQDTGRIAQGFLFGSGFGTYANVFTRFKQATFNQNSTLWPLTFFRSSSFILELLATTGILGLLAFIFLIYKIIKQKTLFSIFSLAVIASFVLPFSFTIQSLFFILLAILSALEGLKIKEHKKFFDVEIQLVALRKGLIAFDPSPSSDKTKALPQVFFVVILFIVGLLGFFSARYLISDITFQNSLVAASQNNGSLTYRDQTSAIAAFPYRDAYYRIFSQTNLALANSLVAQQPKNSTPSAQTQQTIITLIQQSITSARTAISISPQTALNWQNLSSIYRSLIGFGQNADTFSILANQQAIALDPNNPQEYINLGGIYYQLGQWDNAIRQFQIAITLKPDLANAYYNLGHAIEQKGDLKDALLQYQTVKRLVANDPVSLKKITKEITDLQTRIKSGTPISQEQVPASPSSAQPPLKISTPSAQLPPQNPPIKIPPPNEATKSAK